MGILLSGPLTLVVCGTADPLRRPGRAGARMAAMGPACANAFDSRTGGRFDGRPVWQVLAEVSQSESEATLSAMRATRKSHGLLTLHPTGGNAGYVG